MSSGFVSTVLLLVNQFWLFQATHLNHFILIFHAQGVALKNMVLATKCIFQNFNSCWIFLHFQNCRKTYCAKTCKSFTMGGYILSAPE